MLDSKTLDVLRSNLFSGHYNLLLGSGISLDSTDQYNNPLKSASDLAIELCELKTVNKNTSLSRVSLLLNSDERKQYITTPYSKCLPGETVKRITSFIWNSIFTFNVDDALEAAYESVSRAKQKTESVNYDSIYKTPINKGYLQIIHLHGFTREPEKGYVFSTTEYARETRKINAWMHVLSELIASEPFIIAGTTLNEPDLDYYLSGRTEISGRNNRGPSIYIEPYPDKITENICQRHGLILVITTLAEFLAWLINVIGNPPTVNQITIPSIKGIFKRSLQPEAQVEFFSSFEIIRPSAQNTEGELSPFYFGKSARWSDLESSLDVPTDNELELSAKVRNLVKEDTVNSIKILCVISAPGNGKTTNIRRAGYNLAKEGIIVFNLNEKSTINIDNIKSVISSIEHNIVFVIDNLADHATSLQPALINLKKTNKSIIIIAADRHYRQDHIDRLLGNLDIEYIEIPPWNIYAYEQLINKLQKSGLLGNEEAIYNPKKFANQLIKDTVSIATCRALNNFKPLDEIIRSIWKDSDSDARWSYAITALARHCHGSGIFYPILENSYQNNKLKEQFKLYCPLPLIYTEDGDYVLPLHPVIADRLLHMLSDQKSDLLLKIFCALAKALAPFVNRQTTINKTPESRLASRLFHAEQVTRPLLGNSADQFYIDAQKSWQWNSRYWEQRAILTQDKDIDTAIQYARHAVAIEAHPFPWTTLASLLTKKMDMTKVGIDNLFLEIYTLLTKAINREEKLAWRPTPHPYAILFHATNVFLDNGKRISPKKRQFITQQIEFCKRMFDRDLNLLSKGDQILEKFIATKQE